jgi:hypothetical protein
MKPDEFENQLQRQPIRAVPTEWRAEILREANDSVAAVGADVRRLKLKNASNETDQSLLTSAPTSWSREWLWPSPQAWVGLAALWIAIAVLHATSEPRSVNLAKQTPKLSPEMETTLAAQRRELARLLDNFTEPTPAPKAGPPGPRSENVSPPRV